MSWLLLISVINLAEIFYYFFCYTFGNKVLLLYVCIMKRNTLHLEQLLPQERQLSGKFSMCIDFYAI